MLIYLEGEDNSMNTNPIACSCKYKEVFNTQNTPMIIIDAKTGYIDDANAAACNYYSYSKKELLSMNIADINILTKEDIFKEINEVRTRNLKFLKFQHKLSNDEIRDVEVHSSYFKIGDKELLSSIIHDVKEKSELEKKYLKNKAYFDSLFNNSPEAIAIVDSKFRVLDINDRFKDVFQYDLIEIENQDITKLLCEKTLYDTSYNFRNSILKGEFVSEEVKRRKKDGSILDAFLLGFPLVIDGEITGAYFIYTDISEIKDHKNEIKMLKDNDFLTGLLNRKSFSKNVTNEISKKENNKKEKDELAILVLKLNDFKEINEALGSLVGDSLLKEFALRLVASVQNENIIARIINNEFAIMIPKLKDLKEINTLTNTIIENLKDSFLIDMNELHITTNIGVAIYPDDGEDYITLMRKAEIAMDKSKMVSKNEVIQFENSYDKEVQENFRIKNDLLKSIQNEELFLNYQPIYDITKNTLVGVEALIRWNHKEKGIISPLKFIPIAEKTEMIHPIGEWVLLEACNQNKVWQKLGYGPIYVSVNVSVLQLEEPGFSNMIKRILEDTMLEPQYLQLEITETFFTQDYELIKETIEEISSLGVKFAIDDFGTGYSSLGQLSELSIDNLKIDRKFIDGVDENINNSKIVITIIALANSLGISLTAEGVERQEELSFLKENMCTMVQGYLFSKPVGAYDIERLLKI